VLKTAIRIILNLAKLAIGLNIYLVLNKTPTFAYQAMIKLFCLTEGYSNEILSKIIGYFKPPYYFSGADGVLGAMVEKRRANISSDLREKGYYIFEERLPEEHCNRLLQFAITHPCTMRLMDKADLEEQMVTQYQRENPQAVRYDFDTQDLLNNQDVQNLFADLSFVTVAQDYLKARPVIDVTSMWWHTHFSDEPDMAAAQYYHFDMDRPKWLKFFIYLTDVGPTNGPHTFVAGSHKQGGIPLGLLKKGYARLTDKEVEAAYDEKNIVEFNAPRGTIIAEDTRGLHKGKHVQEGDRLILQIQFSNSLFGGSYPKSKLGGKLTGDLKNKMELFPKLYLGYF